jgi:hypothetical protein
MNQEFDLNNPDASMLTGDDPEYDYNYMKPETGGMVTQHNGVADKLLQNNKLYNAMKGDWKRTDYSNSHNMKVTTGRQDGKFYITHEQENVREIAARVKLYREHAEQGIPDTFAPLMPDGTLGWRWIDLPRVCEKKICNDYFGNMPWAIIKKDRTLKAQFYRVVQQEYPAFVCYPNGKLPIPIDVPYPAKVGEQKFFKGGL